jgi:hypothetical protein
LVIVYIVVAITTEPVMVLVSSLPALLSVTLAYGITLAYGFWRFYGTPVSDDWLKIPLGRLTILAAVGIFAAVVALVFTQSLTVDVKASGTADTWVMGTMMGVWIMGPTLVVMPIGYVIGALVSPEAED